METSRLPASTRFSQWPWLVVLAVIVFVGFIRYRLLEMPLERDEGEYAYAGQLILQGIPPYELACNFKLPGTYYAYALGMACFGQTVSGVHLTLLAVNTLIIVFVYLLGRRLFGIGLLSWNLLCQSDVLFELSPERACQTVYPQNPFVEAPRAAEYIRNHAPPGARIAVIGSEPEIYFYTRLHSATTYIYGYDLMDAHPYAAKMQREMIQQVESSKPEFLVLASCQTPGSPRPTRIGKFSTGLTDTPLSFMNEWAL